MLTVRKIVERLKAQITVLQSFAPNDEVIGALDFCEELATELEPLELVSLISQKIEPTALVIDPKDLVPGDAFLCMVENNAGEITNEAYLLVKISHHPSHGVSSVPLSGENKSKVFQQAPGGRGIFSVVGKRGIAETLAFIED